MSIARQARRVNLVSNAGFSPRHDFLEMPEEVWDRAIAVNLKGAFLCGQVAALRMMGCS